VTHIREFWTVALVFGGALAFTSCGSDKPANPTPPTTQPAPAPSPTPTPTPTGGPGALRSCGGPPPTGSVNNCGFRPDPQLARVLAQSLDEVHNHKDIFYPDGVTIRYLDKFRQTLVTALDNREVCGIFDYGNRIGDEIYLRTADNRLSEAYDVISGTGQTRVGYQNSCEPAAPFPPAPPSYRLEDGSCGLPGSVDSFCLGRNFDSDYAGDVRGAIVAVIDERPELFDKSDTLNSELSYKLNDARAYTAAVVAKLRAKGYCAIEDEELLVKKDNSLSENFDIVRSPGDRPSQYSLYSYKGRCHNATF